MPDPDTTPDTVPDDAPDQTPDSLPDADRRDDQRSDIEQAVAARSDAVARGEGGAEPATFTDDDLSAGVGGAGGVVKNQEGDAQ